MGRVSSSFTNYRASIGHRCNVHKYCAVFGVALHMHQFFLLNRVMMFLTLLLHGKDLYLGRFEGLFSNMCLISFPFLALFMSLNLLQTIKNEYKFTIV